MSTGMGFPSHSHNIAPCLMCRQSKFGIFNHDIAQPLSEHPHENYDTDCSAHEMYIVIENEEAHRIIRFRLERKSTYRGRGMAMNVALPNQPQLLKGDRLEPTPTLLDTNDFDRITTFPAIVKFWRPSKRERVYHRNPILDESLGIGLHSFSIDELHCMHL
eukprot:1707715-Pyramimonas_sp.AAC.1